MHAIHKRTNRGHKRQITARELAKGAARWQGVGACTRQNHDAMLIVVVRVKKKKISTNNSGSNF